MPLYESVFIARQDISAPQVEALADSFAKIIEDQGGTVAKREHWGLRSLAYKIKKNRKGHYVLFNLDAPSDAIHEMERLMTIHEDVLRHLTLRMDELDPEPSIIMQRGSSRDDRDRDRPRRHDSGPPRESRSNGPDSAAKSSEATPAKSKDAEAKDTEAKDTKSKDTKAEKPEAALTESKEAESKETESKEAESKEAEAKEAESKEAEAKDAKAKDTKAEKPEAALTESKEAESKEAEAKDAEPKKAEAKDAKAEKPDAKGDKE